MNYVLGRSRSVHWALARSMFPVMCLSAFLNNTPCVTFMIPSESHLMSRPGYQSYPMKQSASTIPSSVHGCGAGVPLPYYCWCYAICGLTKVLSFTCALRSPHLVGSPLRCAHQEAAHPAVVRGRAGRHLHLHRHLHQPGHRGSARRALHEGEKARRGQVSDLRHRALRSALRTLGVCVRCKLAVARRLLGALGESVASFMRLAL